MKRTKKKTMVTSISLFVAVCIAAVILVSQVVNAVIFGSNVREDCRTLLQTQTSETPIPRHFCSRRMEAS